MPRYQNNQLWYECQLVAVWNAIRFWGGGENLPVMGTPSYKQACEHARAIVGGVIDLDRELEIYNVHRVRGKYDLRWIRSHLPVHFAVFCHRGYHSVLAVGIYGSSLLLANYARNRLHWMPWSILLSKANKRVKPLQYVVDQLAARSRPS